MKLTLKKMQKQKKI